MNVCEDDDRQQPGFAVSECQQKFVLHFEIQKTFNFLRQDFMFLLLFSWNEYDNISSLRIQKYVTSCFLILQEKQKTI